MYEVIFLFVLGLIWILFATIQDFRTKEVSNWLNFSLIFFVLAFRFFYSFFSQQDFSFFAQGLIGLGIFFLIGNLFYYGRVFAGGDAKLMIALGPILPLTNIFENNLSLFYNFIIIFLISGAIYTLFASIFLALKNFNRFRKEFRKLFEKNKKIISGFIIVGTLFLFLGFFSTLYFMIGLLFFIFPYLYLFVKAVDEAAMVRKINWKNLTEGDWLYKDVKIGKKVLKANWDGLTKKDISFLVRNKKNVFVRNGVPFTIVFLISFLVFFYLGFPFG